MNEDILDLLLVESPNVYYVRRGGDVFKMDHGSKRHYCTVNSWPHSKAFTRGAVGGPSLSMGPEKIVRSLARAQRVG